MMGILEEFIKEIKKFGIKKVAEISGVSKFTIYDWTRGKIIPTLVNAQKGCECYGIRILVI